MAESKAVITLNLDDSTLKNELERRIRTELVEEIKKQIKIAMFKPSYSYQYSPGKNSLSDWLVDFIKEVIVQEKPKIIKAAAHELCESMRRSSKVREKFGELLDEEMKE